MRHLTLIVVAALTAGMLAHCSAQELTRDMLGRDVKFRIVVDKVMQPEAGWTTEEWMVKEAADAGFNVYSPRRGYSDLDAVRQVTQWCEKYGIFHLVWMRGTLGVQNPDEAQGRMLVWRNGGEQPLWSPNSDEFWEWTTRYITEYARISADNPHLLGVFLDYENYAKGQRMSGSVYDLSYDQMTLDMFAEAQGVEIPQLEPAERYQWLQNQGLHDQFEAWQLDHWRQRCRTLREAVDEHDPGFQFCMYPAPGTRFMREAAFPEWTSEEAPLIFADAVTYGRRTSFLPQSGALQQGRRLLAERMQGVAEIGLPHYYTGGIDPVVRGADPEYCGKNAVMISAITDGYWIFYEGPEYQEDHPNYWMWFTWANDAIAAGELQRWQEARETPDPWAFGGIGTGEAGLSAPEPTGETVELPLVKLRRRNLLLVNAAAGEPAELGVTIGRVGDAEADLEWSAHDLTWEQIAEGTVPFGDGTISFTPQEGGIYALNVVAGSSSYAITSANVPVGIYAGRGLGIIGAAQRLYFAVPEDAEQFAITARGFGAETARLNVHDPAGEMAATGQTTPTEERVTVEVQAGDHAGETWALEIARADIGTTLEDVHLSLGDQLPPVLSLIPEHVFEAE
ncbi:MAG: hypothetical protein U9R79_02770 [Armatimonadota bacterium]|nr:hypothetical protein [Armatimonadota bacterium]